jgi:CheY-like chemotaxis protein
MGGTIWVYTKGQIGGYPPPYWQSDIANNPTQGSTFYFTFIAQEVVASDSVSHLSQVRINFAENNDISSLKILLAEDNRVNQKVALLTLKKLRYEADVANNGLEVLTRLEEQTYDIIFMDMQMPEMDGVTTTRMIRQSLSLAQPYIIALTANALDADRSLCLEVGMNDFLTKPIVIAELNRVLANYIKTTSNWQ